MGTAEHPTVHATQPEGKRHCMPHPTQGHAEVALGTRGNTGGLRWGAGFAVTEVAPGS